MANSLNELKLKHILGFPLLLGIFYFFIKLNIWGYGEWITSKFGKDMHGGVIGVIALDLATLILGVFPIVWWNWNRKFKDFDVSNSHVRFFGNF